VGGEVVGQGGELGGVAAEAFHLVHGEDDAAVRGVGLDLAGERERGLELGADPDPGADLLGEDLVPGVPCAASASSWDCSSWLAGSAVGRGLGAQQLGQAWHFGEAAGVVGAGDSSGPGTAR